MDGDGCVGGARAGNRGGAAMKRPKCLAVWPGPAQAGLRQGGAFISPPFFVSLALFGFRPGHDARLTLASDVPALELEELYEPGF